jgi:hypothetical protein
MSHAEVQKEVEIRIKAQMTAQYPTVTIRWENVDTAKTSEGVLIAPRIMPGKSFRRDIGGKKSKRAVGIMQVDVMVPDDTATGLRNEIAEFLGDFFEEKQYFVSKGKVTFENPEYSNRGFNNGFYRLVLRLPYTIDTQG